MTTDVMMSPDMAADGSATDSTPVSRDAGSVVDDGEAIDVANVVDVVDVVDVPNAVEVVDVASLVDVRDVGTGCITNANCSAGHGCDVGVCRPWTCTPGTASCADRFMRRVCAENGLALTTTSCAAGALCSGAGLCRSYRDVVMASGPAAYWRFEETSGPTATDEVAGLVATATSGVDFAQAGLIGSGRAVAFHGAQALNIPYAPALNPAEFSIEVWARVTGSAGTYRSPITSRGGPSRQGYALYVDIENRWNLFIGDGVAAGWQVLPVGGAVTIGQTYHVVATFSANTMRIYLNGGLAGSRTSGFLPNTLSSARIGAGEERSAPAFFFDGLVDELAVYARALPAAEIAEHWAQGSGS